MSGSQYIFAKPVWQPIPASPLGNSASGPVQSNDMRRLWWWTGSQIACFDLASNKWYGPWPWDGSVIYYASQGLSPVLFYTNSSVPYRCFNRGKITSVFNLLPPATSIGNTKYSGYLGHLFDGMAQNFYFDPGFPDTAFFLIIVGTAYNVSVIFGINIKTGVMQYGVVVGNQFGNGSECYIQQRGLMGAGSPFYFRLSTVTGNPNFGGTNVPQSQISENYVLETDNTCFANNGNGLGGTVYFGRDSAWQQYTMNTGEGNFDANLENIVAGTPNGGYIGQGNLLLIESKTGAGNPSSFVFSTYSRTSDGSAGIFGTPIEVGYNPLGDAAIEYAGYETAPYIGANGSTEWFSLALGEFSFNSHNTVNFMGTML